MVLVETKQGDRLDLLAYQFLSDSTRWEEISNLNLTLPLFASSYLPPGLFLQIPENVAAKIPDLLPWNDTTETVTFEPVIGPPDLQSGAEQDEILSGSGWLSPVAVRLLIGALSVAELPPYPTIASLGAVATVTYTAGLALKLDASARSAASGVAPLDGGSLVPIANLPAYPTLASLGAVSTSTYTAGLALKLDASARSAANGVAPLDGGSLVPIENLPLNTFQTFTGGVSFKGGGSPGLATNTQAGIDGSGFPRYWLVNALAPVNSRIKSITVVNNGNVQIRHHNDDLSEGNVLEHTASGNVLTNGTVRPGSGATAFSGATFLPGAIYFRTDLATGTATGELTYSDGDQWRRVKNSSLASGADPGIVDLTSGQTITGNKIFLNHTQFGNQTVNFTNGTTSAGVGTAGQDAVFSLHCSGSGLGVFAFDLSALRVVLGSQGGRPLEFCTNIGGTPGADNLVSATPVMRISGSNITLVNLPTASTGLTTGMLWRNGNVVNIV
jgi:hypothetical protein